MSGYVDLNLDALFGLVIKSISAAMLLPIVWLSFSLIFTRLLSTGPLKLVRIVNWGELVQNSFILPEKSGPSFEPSLRFENRSG